MSTDQLKDNPRSVSQDALRHQNDSRHHPRAPQELRRHGDDAGADADVAEPDQPEVPEAGSTDAPGA